MHAGTGCQSGPYPAPLLGLPFELSCRTILALGAGSHFARVYLLPVTGVGSFDVLGVSY